MCLLGGSLLPGPAEQCYVCCHGNAGQATDSTPPITAGCMTSSVSHWRVPWGRRWVPRWQHKCVWAIPAHPAPDFPAGLMVGSLHHWTCCFYFKGGVTLTCPFTGCQSLREDGPALGDHLSSLGRQELVIPAQPPFGASTWVDLCLSLRCVTL